MLVPGAEGGNDECVLLTCRQVKAHLDEAAYHRAGVLEWQSLFGSIHIAIVFDIAIESDLLREL